MKSVNLILGFLFVAGSAIANPVSKIEKFECGLQVGKSIGLLAQTLAKDDVITVSEEIGNYITTTDSVSQLKTEMEKELALQSANNSWQSILFYMDKIKDVSPVQHSDISKACDLGLTAD